MTRGGTTAKRLLGAAPAMGVLIVLATAYLPFVSDDALISLRYAERLLDGKGLTWTDGETVEGYSNLLWILLCAGLGSLGVDLIVAARALGYVGSAATLLAVHRAFGSCGLRGSVPAAAASLALAVSGPIAVWTVGGLEQPLLAALLAWALATGLPLLEPEPRARAWLLPGLLLALACWTRPDAPLFTAAACAGLLAARGRDAKSLSLCLRLAALPLLAYLAQLGFRLVYYGEWVPNSALAKLAFTTTRLTEGLSYVGIGLLWSIPLALPAIVFAFLPTRDTDHARRVRFLIAPLLAWTAYVAVVGGDSFPARRHFVPILVILAFLLAQGLRQRIRNNERVPAWLVPGIALGLLALGVTHAFDPENHRARLERWEWDGEVAGGLLREAFPADTLLAVDSAGTLPFFSGLPAVDMLGVNDRYLATHHPEDFGRGPLGHELGNGRYVLDREPDVILFCGPAGGARPCFRSGREMIDDPRFRERYRLVTLTADQPRRFTFQPWIRAEGGPIGIRRGDDRVEVPAYLLMATGKSVARLAEDGRLVLDVTPTAPAGIGALRLPAGKWRLTTTPGSPVLWKVGLGGTRELLAGGRGSVVFELPHPGSPAGADVDLLLETADNPVTVSGIVAERVVD